MKGLFWLFKHNIVTSVIIATGLTAVFGLALVFGIYQSLDAWTKTSFQDVIVAFNLIPGVLIVLLEFLDHNYDDKMSELKHTFFYYNTSGPLAMVSNAISYLATGAVIFGALFVMGNFLNIMSTGYLIVAFGIAMYEVLPDTGDDYWLVGLWLFCVIVGLGLGWIDLTEWIKVQTVIIPLIQGFLGGI